MSWHPDHHTLDRYTAGDLPASGVMSVEAHVSGCGHCRGSVAAAVDAARLDRIWTGVVDRVDAPRPLVLERIAVRFGVPSHTARVVALTPTLRLPWIAAVTACLAFAAATTSVMGSAANLPFLVIAPLVPVGAVALSFGRGFDPQWEINRATATGVVRLLLLRSAAVLAVSLVAAAALAALLPGPALHAVAWLLPALALVVASLALATRVPIVVAAGVAATAWVAGVTVVGWATSDSAAAFRPTGQLVALAVTVLSAVVLGRGRNLLERRPLISGG